MFFFPTLSPPLSSPLTLIPSPSQSLLPSPSIPTPSLPHPHLHPSPLTPSSSRLSPPHLICPHPILIPSILPHPHPTRPQPILTPCVPTHTILTPICPYSPHPHHHLFPLTPSSSPSIPTPSSPPSVPTHPIFTPIHPHSPHPPILLPTPSMPQFMGSRVHMCGARATSSLSLPPSPLAEWEGTAWDWLPPVAMTVARIRAVSSPCRKHVMNYGCPIFSERPDL